MRSPRHFQPYIKAAFIFIDIMQLIHAYILVVVMHRGILLLVDTDRGKAEHRIRKTGKLPRIRTRRENKGDCRGIGEALLNGLFDVPVAGTIKRGRAVILVVLAATTSW